MAYITKRGSSYGVRYTYQDEQGKNCNKWESFSTKEEATNRKKQIEHELANGTFLIPSTITVKEFLMEWLPKQCNKHKWAPCTYQSNLGTVQNLIIPYIGDMQMQKAQALPSGRPVCHSRQNALRPVLRGQKAGAFGKTAAAASLWNNHPRGTPPAANSVSVCGGVGCPHQKPRSGGQPQEIDSGACHLGCR